MRTVFVDTFFWVGILSPKDELRQQAREAEAAVRPARFVTTEPVLIEVLNLYAERKHLRQATANFIKGVLANPDIEVIPHSHDMFLNGLRLYESRPDKGYSVTDCISMNVMRERGIIEVLTHDHHFVQEGFVVLI